MSIILGGAFAAGAFTNFMQSEAAGTANTSLSQWLRLAPDHLGRPYLVLAARISQWDYYNPGGQSKYRSELAGLYTKLAWGQTYCYHWRMTVPKDWYSLGASSVYIVAQLHDVNAGAVGRRPTFAIEIADSTMNFVFSRDSVTAGQAVYSTPVVAGQEYEFTIRVRWADGTNTPDADGLVEIFSGGALVASFAGRNTWAGTAVTEPNPPYLKAGVYQAGPAFTWWDGKSATMYYTAALTATGDESPASIRAQIDAQLRANPNKPVLSL